MSARPSVGEGRERVTYQLYAHLSRQSRDASAKGQYSPSKALNALGVLHRAAKRAERLEVENEQLSKKVQELSLDPVTGFAKGRPSFHAQLAAAVERVANGEQATMCMIDLTNLGGLNKRLTNPGADLVLTELAQILRQALTNLGDVSWCKWGGDEFTAFVIGPEVDPLAISRRLAATGDALLRLAESWGDQSFADIPHTKTDKLGLLIGIGLCWGLTAVLASDCDDDSSQGSSAGGSRNRSRANSTGSTGSDSDSMGSSTGSDSTHSSGSETGRITDIELRVGRQMHLAEDARLDSEREHTPDLTDPSFRVVSAANRDWGYTGWHRS